MVPIKKKYPNRQDWQKRMRADGRCPQCGKDAGGFFLCALCRAKKNRARARARGKQEIVRFANKVKKFVSDKSLRERGLRVPEILEFIDTLLVEKYGRRYKTPYKGYEND